MILGITGSSGAGKSTVCEILEKTYNVQIINTDKIARELSKPKTKYLQEIVKEFGDQILFEDGELNRRKLADIIYSSQDKRNKLNAITFKYIRKETEKCIENSNKKNIAIDAPLLLEANMQELCNATIAVISENRKLQIQRIIKRDNINKEHAIARLNAQQPNEFYIKNCNYTLKNNKTLNAQIDYLMQKIILQ